MTRRSLTILKVLGIPVRVHWSFLLLVALLALSFQGSPPSVIEATAIWLFALFASVTAHELSHSLVARRLGLRVRDIVLLPIGGVSQIEGMTTSPRIETIVAAAGPLMSVALGCLFLLAGLASGARLWPPALFTGSWLVRIGWLNLALAAFNLLPALPMDGGRVLRGLLSRRRGDFRATRATAGLAAVLGAAMIGYGLERDYFLVLIGAFVIAGASSEWRSARARDVLRYFRVGSLMSSDRTTVPGRIPVAEVAGWLAHFPGRALPVVDDAGNYFGITDGSDLAKAPPAAPVGEACDRDSPVLSPESDVTETVLEAFRLRRQLAVVSQGRVVGVLYSDAVLSVLGRAGG